jgi:tRNA nucleotidyltransferase/poly(A) polymerase
MIQINSNIFPKVQGAYIVGGSIRDLLLGKSPIDYDIAVMEDPKKYAQQLATNISGHLVELGKPDQTLIRVVSESHHVDISRINGASIEEDLHNRDFTINAMAYELSSGKLIDCFGSQRDLANKIIRLVSHNAFENDPVRLLRAYRIGACLNFAIAPKTLSEIQRHADLIRNSASERIREELLKMLGTSISHRFLSQMAESKLLFKIFPELLNLKKCRFYDSRQPNAFAHTLDAYGHLENMLTDLNQFLPKSLTPHYQHLDDTLNILLKCCILFHDIGRPRIDAPDKNGTHRFYGHEKKSADMAKGICQRYKYSARHTNYIHFIVQHHAQPYSLFAADQNKTLAPKDLTRFFMECTDRTPDLMLHAIGEMKSKSGSCTTESQAFLDFAAHILQDDFTVFKSKASTPPLINGHDLIQAFGLKPSPLFKAILHFIEEERLSGKKMTRADALRLAKKYLKNHHLTK